MAVLRKTHIRLDVVFTFRIIGIIFIIFLSIEIAIVMVAYQKKVKELIRLHLLAEDVAVEAAVLVPARVLVAVELDAA